MRVLHLTRDLPPAANGGLSTAVAGARDALIRSGVACAVASFDGWRPAHGGSRTDGARLDAHGHLRITGGDPSGALRVFAEGFGPDLLHVHDAMLWEHAAALEAATGARPVFTPHVVHCEQHALRGLEGDTHGLAGERRAVAAATRVLAPSRFAAARLIDAYPAARARVEVGGLGVHRAPGRSRPAPRPPVLLVAGRFGDMKGTDLLLDALPHLLRRHPQARIVIAGGIPETPRRDRRWRTRLTRRLEALDEPARRRVHAPGWLDPGQVERALTEATLLLAPSRTESFGQAVLEAMAHGVPVVAARAGALPELVEDGVTGVTFAAGDAAALAAAVDAALDRPPEELEAMGRNAAARVEDRWLWRRVVPRWIACYRTALGAQA